MPEIDLGLVAGPAGAQGATGPAGAEGKQGERVSRARTVRPGRRETPVLTEKAHTKRHLPAAMSALRRNLGVILQTYKTPSSTTQPKR